MVEAQPVEGASQCDDATPEAVDDRPPCRFLVPGRVIHLYDENGLTRAAYTHCMHDIFLNLQPSADMLTNHQIEAYAESLVQAAISKPKVPRWESFDERPVCACCQTDFSWAIVLRSEPQRMLSRHHCRRCGRVVCTGCSQRMLAQPDIGFLQPVRTCDSCYFSYFRRVGGQPV